MKQQDYSRREFLEKSLSMAVVASLPFAATGQEKVIETEGDEITRMDATALSSAILSRAVSCEEVMSAYLGRIERLNPTWNALVSMREHSELLEEARSADRELASSGPRGWMHGFPHAVKDLSDVRGIRTSRGSPIFDGYVPEQDGLFVSRIRDAGAIFIGKTNVPELGLGSQSYNPVFGTTFNAYDVTRTAGGSSGGAACALALDLVPVADGSDFMGSLRNPAAYNNVIGFRPSFGRVPGGENGELFIQQLGGSGPMGRTVSDTAMLLSVMAGRDARVPLSIDQDPSQFTGSLESDVSGLRIGWLGDYGGYLPMEQGVLDLCRDSLTFFEDLGCTVEEATVDYSMERLWQTWLVHRHWAIGGLAAALTEHKDKMKPEVLWEIEGGQGLTASDISRASAARSDWYRAVLALFDSYDFLVLPSAQVFPFDAETHWPRDVGGREMDTYHRWMEVVIGGTLSGCPIINIPAGFNADGLPMGMQLWGPKNGEMDVLKMAYAYEQASRWNIDFEPDLSDLTA